MKIKTLMQLSSVLDWVRKLALLFSLASTTAHALGYTPHIAGSAIALLVFFAADMLMNRINITILGVAVRILQKQVAKIEKQI